MCYQTVDCDGDLICEQVTKSGGCTLVESHCPACGYCDVL